MQYKLKPWSHQIKTIEKVKNEKRDYFALFFDMGAGKTKTALELLRVKAYELNRVPKTLIVCPVVVMQNWAREILMHTYFDVEIIEVVDGCTYPTGRRIKNPTKKLKLQQASSNRVIYICSTQTVDGKSGSVWQTLKKQGFECLIVDEAHQFKAYKGKRVEALHSLTHDRSLKYRFILTGTPVLQDATDLWAQFYLLNPNILGSNFFSFRAKYFYDKNAGMPSHLHFPDWQPKDAAYFEQYGEDPEATFDHLNKVIYEHAHRVMKHEVLELPPFYTETVAVEMEGEHKRVYEDFRKDLVAFLETKESNTRLKNKLEKELLEGSIDLDDFELPETMKADLAIVKTIRLQQLVCGIFTNTEGEVTLMPTKRLEMLRNILEQINASDPTNKTIVWSVFKPTYEQIAEVCSELGLNFVFINGSMSKEQKDAAIDSFNEDPNVHVCIANQAAGGTGCNLTAANWAVYYSRSFNLAHDLQSEARNYRGGQTRPCTRVDIITEDTIDSRVLERLKEKKQHAEDILRTTDFKAKEVRSLI